MIGVLMLVTAVQAKKTFANVVVVNAHVVKLHVMPYALAWKFVVV